ncbi:unnamed protein product, partial [Symbiodinium microadriaticum]
MSPAVPAPCKKRNPTIEPVKVNGTGGTPANAGAMHEPAGGGEVSCYSEVGSGVPKPDVNDDDGDRDANRGGVGCSEKTASVGEVGSMGCNRDLHKAGEHAEEAVLSWGELDAIFTGSMLRLACHWQARSPQGGDMYSLSARELLNAWRTQKALLYNGEEGSWAENIPEISPTIVNYWLLALVIEGIPCIIAYCRYGFEGVVATLATSLLTGAAAFGAGLLGGLVVSRVEGAKYFDTGLLTRFQTGSWVLLGTIPGMMLQPPSARLRS